jgi:hypothetical protein
MSADGAAGAQVDGHQLAYLAQFEAGSKRQGEKNKCATVRKSAFFNFAVNRFVENIRSVNEEYAKLGVLFTQAHARCEECLKEAKDEHRRHVEQEEKSYGGMVKLNKIVEQYQLNRISTMPRSEHRAVEAENARLLVKLQVLHEKCWNFEARVSQECSRLGMRQKSGRKKNPENQPQDNPFREHRLASEATEVACPSPQIKILVKRRHVKSPTKKSPTKKARSASGIPDLYQ